MTHALTMLAPVPHPTLDGPGPTPATIGEEIPIANIYYLLCYAWDVLDEKDTLLDVSMLDSTPLLDLFARVLVNGSRRLLQRGLDRGYQTREDELPGLRGKLSVTQTLRRQLLCHTAALPAPGKSWNTAHFPTGS
jgi:5-methylcytosine-specific restriction endonuclease McrBC regulatory subunit McrC